MKKMHVNGHIITFVEDGIPEPKPSDVELVERLSASPNVPDEVKALCRIVLSLHNKKNEIHYGKSN